MPYKNKNKQNEYSKNKMREIRNRKKNDVIPVIPEPPVIPVIPVIPEHNPFIYDIMRFELLFDTIRMRELLLRKTRFNVWMNCQLNVLEELENYFKLTKL